jgi:hypothetical protein
VKDQGRLLLICADLDNLVFLPTGEAVLTRRAKAACTLRAARPRRQVSGAVKPSWPGGPP